MDRLRHRGVPDTGETVPACDSRDTRVSRLPAAALIAYGPSLRDNCRRAAAFVDKILGGGAWPGDPPIEQPTKFELAVNLKAAKALGLTILSRSSSGPTRSSTGEDDK